MRAYELEIGKPITYERDCKLYVFGSIIYVVLYSQSPVTDNNIESGICTIFVPPSK